MAMKYGVGAIFFKLYHMVGKMLIRKRVYHLSVFWKNESR